MDAASRDSTAPRGSRVEVATDSRFRHVVEPARRPRRRRPGLHGAYPGRRPQARRASTTTASRPRTRRSRVGTFRTLPPADSNQPLRIGFYSCQSYEAGYYTAHAALAKEKDLDLVLCLGDYIYEHHYYDGPAGRVDKTGANKDGDVQTLAEYRQKYRFYQSDKTSRTCTRPIPLSSIWDDHEVEDNYAGTQPDSASTDPAHFENNNSYPRRVRSAQRRKNGYKAFFEAMPRIAARRATRTASTGRFRLGKMAELFLTDERQYRDPQPCNDVQLQSCPDDMQPGRTFLGERRRPG